MDLETISRQHVFTYLCTLLGCYGDVLHINVDDGDSHDVDMESKGNGALDICDDALVIAYLQAREVLIGLRPKEKIVLNIRPNGSNGKVIPSYKCGQMDK